MSEQFDLSYQQLNPLQRLAVDHIEAGPLLVVAGPGTGKTQVLTLRIANILRNTDAKPENILALTFTEAAAKNMRQRLVELIGKEAYQLQISTFHGFCRQVIAEHGEYFALQRDSEHLSDLERYQQIQNLLDEHRPEYLYPINTPYFYVRDILSAISDLKREGISPLKFEDILVLEQDKLDELMQTSKNQAVLRQAQQRLHKQKNLSLIYQHYQQNLANNSRFDYDDMINFVVNAFREQEDLLLEYQERLQYFLVDEYQDTNSAQNQLVNLLASYWDEPDLCVVGDPNQAIYRFQGASVENVLSFTRNYAQATVITLDTAYRCPQNIYDSATELIQLNQLSAEVAKTVGIDLVLKLNSPKGIGEPIQIDVFPNQMVEAMMIAKRIQALLDQGVVAEEIAVLYHDHSDANSLKEVLEASSISFQLNKSIDALSNRYVQDLLQVMRLLLSVRTGLDEALLSQVMLLDWTPIAQVHALRLTRMAGQLRLNLHDLLQKTDQEIATLLADQKQSLDAETIQAGRSFVALISDLSLADYQLSLPELVAKILSKEGLNLLEQLQNLKEEQFVHIVALNTLFNQVKGLARRQNTAKLADFLTLIDVLAANQLPLAMEKYQQPSSITLSTVHSAKGMEWQHVFVINMVDHKWGNKRDQVKLKLPDGILQHTDLAKKELNEDERRLFYVALTRAKEKLYLSYPETLLIDGQSSEKFPSIFLDELQGFKTPLLKNVHQNLDLDEPLMNLLSVKKSLSTSMESRAFLESIVADFTLSVTALNNYLRDPKDFFYNNLLRVPRFKEVSAAFGTAVHKALEIASKQMQLSKELPDLDLLLESFNQALKQEILSSADFDNRLKHGQEILRTFYKQRFVAYWPIFDVERSRKVFLNDLPLSGKIDRIDIIGDQGKQLRVVDYKTGRVKSMNEIEAQTQSSLSLLSKRERELPASIRGPYKRQLVFYQLLLSLDRTLPKQYTISESAFEFIEPAVKGGDEHVSRALQISQTEVDELKTLITQVMEEIRSLKFLEAL